MNTELLKKDLSHFIPDLLIFLVVLWLIFYFTGLYHYYYGDVAF